MASSLDWRRITGGALVALAAYLASKPRRVIPTNAVTIRDGVLTALGARAYRLTRDDLLWLGRALVGEVSESASDWSNAETQRGGSAIAWALAQNFMLLGRTPPRFETFTELVRAYCQPVNPLWMDPNGRKCRANPEACSQTRLDRRRRFSMLSWNELPDPVRSLLSLWPRGDTPNPVPGSTDWRNSPWGKNPIEIAGNYFGDRRAS